MSMVRNGTAGVSSAAFAAGASLSEPVLAQASPKSVVVLTQNI